MTNEGTPPPQPVPPAQPYAQAPYPQPPQKKSRIGLIIGIVAGVLLLLCGGGTAAVLAIGAAADSDDKARVYEESVDISDRTEDSKPLTVAEVFPGKTLTVKGRVYTVLKTENLTACAKAAQGRTVPAVEAGDCTQVVRATVVDAKKKYLATLGLVNLKDAAAANAVRDSALDPNEGTFLPMVAPGTAAAKFGTVSGFISSSWTNGHYYGYGLVGMADNQEPSMSDPGIDQVIGDLQQLISEPIDHREF
jgi:hypothetical protein